MNTKSLSDCRVEKPGLSRLAHNEEFVGSNPTSATNTKKPMSVAKRTTGHSRELPRPVFNPTADSHLPVEAYSPSAESTLTALHKLAKPVAGVDFVRLCNAEEVAEVMELECCFSNEVVEDKDGFVQLAPYGDKENTTPDGLKVIQRFQKKHAETLKSEFDAAAKDESDAFMGLPIYKGHPDRDGNIPRGKDARKIGRTMQLQVRDDGLYGTRLMNSNGTQLVKSGQARFPSMNWFARPAGVENGKLVMEPFEAISWGVTPHPNLPVKPLVNSAIVEKFSLTNGDAQGHEFHGNQYTAGQSVTVDANEHERHGESGTVEKVHPKMGIGTDKKAQPATGYTVKFKDGSKERFGHGELTTSGEPSKAMEGVVKKGGLMPVVFVKGNRALQFGPKYHEQVSALKDGGETKINNFGEGLTAKREGGKITFIHESGHAFVVKRSDLLSNDADNAAQGMTDDDVKRAAAAAINGSERFPKSSRDEGKWEMWDIRNIIMPDESGKFYAILEVPDIGLVKQAFIIDASKSAVLGGEPVKTEMTFSNANPEGINQYTSGSVATSRALDARTQFGSKQIGTKHGSPEWHAHGASSDAHQASAQAYHTGTTADHTRAIYSHLDAADKQTAIKNTVIADAHVQEARTHGAVLEKQGVLKPFRLSEREKSLTGMAKVALKPGTVIGHRIADIGPGGKEHNVKTGKSLSNSEVEPGGTPATNQGEKMDKAKLIALLATVGVTLANDANEEAIEKAMTEKFGEVKAAADIKVALSNAETAKKTVDDELKTAKEVLAQKETLLTNEQQAHQTAKTKADEAVAKLGVVEGEKVKLSEDLKIAQTTLANATEERGKTAHQAAKLATDLTEAKTTLGIRDAALSNEKAAHNKTVTSLANAKKGIVDLSIAYGKIPPAKRGDLTAALANEVDFAGICDQLAKAQPFFKMVPLVNAGGQTDPGSLDPMKQFNVLVNETLHKQGIDPAKRTQKQYDKAYAEIKQSEQGKALLGLAKQPETGMALVR